MNTNRLIPPSTAFNNPMTANGHQYSCVAGSTIDVPDFDAAVLLANGWVNAINGSVGTTAQRPTRSLLGTNYLDTTISAVVVWDGKTWRDAITGAAA